jgi:hypothetical protein
MGTGAVMCVDLQQAVMQHVARATLAQGVFL